RNMGDNMCRPCLLGKAHIGGCEDIAIEAKAEFHGGCSWVLLLSGWQGCCAYRTIRKLISRTVRFWLATTAAIISFHCPRRCTKTGQETVSQPTEEGAAMTEATADVSHLTMQELEAELAHIRRSPKEQGVLDLIVRRPEPGQRETLAEGFLDLEEG